MSDLSALAALAQGVNQETGLGGGSSHQPAIYWRSGSTETANLIAMMKGNVTPEITMMHTGYFFISEDDVPGNEEGAMVDLTQHGWLAVEFKKRNGDTAKGFGTPDLQINHVNMRRCHRHKDSYPHFYNWTEGWDHYDEGYSRRQSDILVRVKGIEDYPLHLILENARQMAYASNRKEGSVMSDLLEASRPYAAELGVSALPPIAFWMTLSPLLDAHKMPVFTSSEYVEKGETKQGAATTTFELVDCELVTTAQMESGIAMLNESAEWQAEWDVSNPLTTAAEASNEQAQVEAPKGM